MTSEKHSSLSGQKVYARINQLDPGCGKLAGGRKK